VADLYWGTGYLVDDGWDPSDESGDHVVDRIEGIRSAVEVARELWDLAGDKARGDRINDVMTRAFERDPFVLEAGDIDELLALTDGLVERLVGPVVDEHWNVRPDQLPELRRRTRMLELDDGPPNVPEAGVAAGMSRVVGLRNVLTTARDEKLRILFD
jgi:hypothetical protein